MSSLVRPYDYLSEQVRVDYVSATVEYHGYAKPGTETRASGWKIQKITMDSSGRVTLVQHAGNNQTAPAQAVYGLYDQVWDNRASLSYA